jgi:hypothetical protein
VLEKATACRVADRYQTVEEFWDAFTRVGVIGASAEEADDEATIVRSRLSTTSPVEQAAAQPNFQTLANPSHEIARPHKARIVVELPTHKVPEAQTSSISSATMNDDTAEHHGTRTFGSPAVEPPPNGAPLRIPARETQGTIVAVEEESTPALRRTNLRVQTLRTERGFLDRVRAVINSEWLRRVFIIFLAAALIGLAASTYYHFAGLKVGVPFFSQGKDGRIAGADNVNLRSAPFGSVLVTLPKDARVRVLEERGNWVRVKVMDWAGMVPDNPPDSGWIDSRFVKLD